MNASHAIFQALGDGAILLLLVPWLGSYVIRYRARQVISQDEDSHVVYYAVFVYACYILYRLIETIRWRDIEGIDPVRTLAVLPIGVIAIITITRVMKLRARVKICNRDGTTIESFEPPSSKVKIYGNRKVSGVNSRGDVLTTELNALADSTFSALGPLYDNSSNRDTFGRAELHVTFASTPNEGHSVDLYGVPALDAANYADGAPPSAACYLGSFQIHGVTSAQVITTPLFELPPCKLKFVAFGNNLGVAFPATGSHVKLFTTNRDIS